MAFLSLLTFLKPIAKPLIYGLILTAIISGLIYFGVRLERTQWEKKELQQNIVVQEKKEEARQVEQQVVTKYVYRDRIIKQKQDAIVQEVTKYETIIDRQCTIPNATIMLLNRAAEGVSTDSEPAIDGSTSTTQ